MNNVSKETQAKVAQKDKPIYTSFIDGGHFLYEEIIDPVTDQPTFICYDKFASVVFGNRLYAMNNSIRYMPLYNDIVRRKIVLLPTDAAEYGDISTLLQVIQTFIHKYVDLTQFGEVLSSYYVLLSWVYDNFETIPYLRFLGDYGNGKTRALKVIGSLCYKALFAGGSITPSPIFRLIEQLHGTLVIDEADFTQSDHAAEIVKILNCGYTKGLPVIRTEGDKKREPKAFDVFGPKIIATRKQFDDLALESRCLTEVMKGNPRLDIPLQLPKTFEEEATQIRNMLLMFRFRYYGAIELDDKLRIDGVEPRINQITMPILAILEDEQEREKLRIYIIEYDKALKTRRSDELPARILNTIIGLHVQNSPLEHKTIAELVNVELDQVISATKIGQVNAADLELETKKINGHTQFIWNESKIRNLCVRYGIEFGTE